MVISYDFERQVDVVRGAGKRLQGLEAQTAFRALLPYLLMSAGVVGLCIILAYRKRLFPTRQERLLRAFYGRVERDCSVRVERGRVGLLELADLTGNPDVRAFADLYAGVVYRDRRLSEEEYIQLKLMLWRGFVASEEKPG